MAKSKKTLKNAKKVAKKVNRFVLSINYIWYYKAIYIYNFENIKISTIYLPIYLPIWYNICGGKYYDIHWYYTWYDK